MRLERQAGMCESMGIQLHYTRMGAVDSLDLMESKHEQEIFDFYKRNKSRYHNVVDIGANIGLHSIIMAKNGWAVTAYEPDPQHYRVLRDNVELNGVCVGMSCAAVSDHHGMERLVRVLGNTTANHLEGSRDSYGERETLVVPVLDCRNVFVKADFAKIDVEGHEAVILCSVPPSLLPDCMVEVGSEVNAQKIFDHLHGKRLMHSSKVGWGKVHTVHDMPHNYKQGSLFIGEWK